MNKAGISEEVKQNKGDSAKMENVQKENSVVQEPGCAKPANTNENSVENEKKSSLQTAQNKKCQVIIMKRRRGDSPIEKIILDGKVFVPFVAKRRKLNIDEVVTKISNIRIDPEQVVKEIEGNSLVPEKKKEPSDAKRRKKAKEFYTKEYKTDLDKKAKAERKNKREEAAQKEREARLDEHRRNLKKEKQIHEEELKNSKDEPKEAKEPLGVDLLKRKSSKVEQISMTDMTEDGKILLNGKEFEILDTYVKEKKKIKEDKDFVLDYYAEEDGSFDGGEDDEMEGISKPVHNYSRKNDLIHDVYLDEGELDQSSSDDDDSNRESASGNDYPDDDQIVDGSDEDIAHDLESKFIDKFVRKTKDFAYSNPVRQNENALLDDYDNGEEFDLYVKDKMITQMIIKDST